MSNIKVGVLDAVRAAAQFARANVRHTAGILAVVMLLNIAGSMVGRSPLGLIIGLAGFLAGVMANAALLRLAFADEHAGDPEFRIGPQGLQWGRPELRLLGGMMLLALFALLAGLLLFIVALVVAIATLALGHPNAPMPTTYTDLPMDLQLAFSILVLIFLLAAIWVAVRICLYPAATVSEKRVQVFSTWALTRGQFLPILGALAILFMPLIVLAVAVEQTTAFPAVQGVLALVLLFGSTFVVVPMVVGLYAHLYRILRLHQPTQAAPKIGPQAGQTDSPLAGPWGSV